MEMTHKRQVYALLGRTLLSACIAPLTTLACPLIPPSPLGFVLPTQHNHSCAKPSFGCYCWGTLMSFLIGLQGKVSRTASARVFSFKCPRASEQWILSFSSQMSIFVTVFLPVDHVKKPGFPKFPITAGLLSFPYCLFCMPFQWLLREWQVLSFLSAFLFLILLVEAEREQQDNSKVSTELLKA